MSNASKFINTLLACEGAPYTWGGGHSVIYTTVADVKRYGVDCSGLLNCAYEIAGLGHLNLVVTGWDAGSQRVDLSNKIAAGTLLINPGEHIGVYIGNGKLIEAQQEGVPVHIRTFNAAEWEAAGVHPVIGTTSGSFVAMGLSSPLDVVKWAGSFVGIVKKLFDPEWRKRIGVGIIGAALIILAGIKVTGLTEGLTK